jgi:hypothetical protein
MAYQMMVVKPNAPEKGIESAARFGVREKCG